jgi:hypothetical protein
VPFATPPAQAALQLDGVFALRLSSPAPHWLLVTRGFTELYDKESADPAASGYGFEVTCRLPARSSEYDFGWALSWLQGLADNLSSGGAWFEPGHFIKLVEPQKTDELCAVAFCEDIVLQPSASKNGTFAFLQMVGLTNDEYTALQNWSALQLLELVRAREPLLWTDAQRKSYLTEPAFLRAVTAGQERDGSSTGAWVGGSLLWVEAHGTLWVHLDERLLAVMVAALNNRLRHGRPMLLLGDPRHHTAADGTVHENDQTNIALVPEAGPWIIEALEDGRRIATLRLSPDALRELATTLQPRPGEYKVAALPNVRFLVATNARMMDAHYPW